MHQSILSYKRSKYLWWCTALCIAAIAAYFIHDPMMPPNGGTWLGYTLGTIGALLILWLMWFGVRKRRYKSNIGTVHGWLSAHVYLGIGLITIVTLHAGFQFGWNIHTLAYTLMVLVVVSGMYGVFCYLHFPAVMTDNRGEASSDSLIRQIQDIDRQALKLASEIDQSTHDKVIKSIQRNTIGGSVLQLLFAKNKTSVLENFSTPKENLSNEKKYNPETTSSTMVFMASNIAKGRMDKGDSMRQLSDLLIGQKEQLLKQLRRDMQLKAFMDLWLYIHVPLSFALLAALLAHIISVFFYW
jgi:hypothetical protein